MGCCASSESNRSSHSASSPTRNHKGSTQAPRSSISRARATESRAPPPPPLFEEETVKEVLSETPKWNPKVSKFEAQQQEPPQKPKNFEKFQRESIKVENYEDEAPATATINKGEEISEVSEVCSLSESVSTKTFTEEEARQRVNRSPARMQKNRSFSGHFAGRTVGNSPARRSEQYPARRNGGSVRVVQSRDQVGNGATRNQPRRRDAGENSTRRSRSPATRIDGGAVRSVVGRSPSVRRGTNQSPSRVRTAASVPESGGRKMENPTMEGNWPSSANESLENPLVSLECFIFL